MQQFRNDQFYPRFSDITGDEEFVAFINLGNVEWAPADCCLLTIFILWPGYSNFAPILHHPLDVELTNASGGGGDFHAWQITRYNAVVFVRVVRYQHLIMESQITTLQNCSILRKPCPLFFHLFKEISYQVQDLNYVLCFQLICWSCLLSLLPQENLEHIFLCYRPYYHFFHQFPNMNWLHYLTHKSSSSRASKITIFL